MNVLKVRDLKVMVGGQTILDNLNLALADNRSYVMFGPNGSGKTTLINSIMGLPQYNVVSGQILFMGEDIISKNVEERSKLGLALAFQQPPEISGVSLSSLLKLCIGKEAKDDFSAEELELIEAFDLVRFLNRDVNAGFSGGEQKRAEILQMLFLKPRLLLLDEPDSGVDVESLRLIGENIQKYVEQNGCTALVVTHKGDILDYVNARYACVLLDSSVHCFAEPKRIYETIKRRGYEKCVACRDPVEKW